MTTYKYLKPWTKPENYIGAEWPDYYVGLSRCRDRSILEESNFLALLAELGGESDTVRVVRESHYALGWIEWIAIHSADTKALELVDSLLCDLESYPILDDDDLSRREWEEAQRIWEKDFSPRERLSLIRANRNEFDFSDFAELLRCVRGEVFCGLPHILVD